MKIYRLYLLAAFFLFTSQIFAKNKNAQLRVQLLMDSNHKGDQNQLLGIMDALSQSQFKNLRFVVSGFSGWDPKQAHLKAPEVLLLSGASGLKFLLENHQNIAPSTYVVWSGHQNFPMLASVAAYINLIALPRSSLESKTMQLLGMQSQLLLLSGVPHRINKHTLAQAEQNYIKEKGKVIESSVSDYVAIILGGDAPDEQGNMKLFTPENSRVVARNIVRQVGVNKTYLITNGPRTGSYNAQSMERINPSPHRSGVVDSVSKAFIEELNSLGISQISLFDFQFSDLPSVYESLLYYATKGMQLYVPGESISMLTESTDVADFVTLYELPSMNKTHHLYANELYQIGRVEILYWNGEFKNKCSNPALKKKQTSAEIVAEHIKKYLLD